MLTRIEIDGFKTFEDFKLDVTPFMVVLGPNAAGKSNLFDVVQLLSRLASTDLRTAFTGLRGEPWELFRRDAKGEPGKRMRLAVEVLVAERLFRWVNAEIVRKSGEFLQKDAQTVHFPVKVGADQEATLSYTVRYTW